MEKRRPGLHKEISTIFNGVPIPKGNGAQQPPDAPKPAYPGYEPQEPPATTPQPPGTPTPARPDNGPQKPPAAAAQTVKPKQTVPSPSKPETAKRAKLQTKVKTVGKNPARQIFEQVKQKLLTPKPGVSSSKHITTVISVPILFLVLIFVFGKSFIKPSAGKANHLGTENKNAAAAANTKIDWVIPEPYPETLRDPMQFGPASGAQKRIGGLVVKGIVYSSNNPCAVIGNDIVHIGEQVMGATVVKINADSVEFESDGKRWTQTVQP